MALLMLMMEEGNLKGKDLAEAERKKMTVEVANWKGQGERMKKKTKRAELMRKEAKVMQKKEAVRATEETGEAYQYLVLRSASVQRSALGALAVLQPRQSLWSPARRSEQRRWARAGQ